MEILRRNLTALRYLRRKSAKIIIVSQRGSIPLDREQIVDIPIPSNNKMAYIAADNYNLYMYT